jgi:hypothetical protein
MHGLTLTTLAKGPEATALLYASWASGSWLQPLVAILELMRNLELMSKCGFAVDMGDMPLEAAAGAAWAPDFLQGTRQVSQCMLGKAGQLPLACVARAQRHQAEFENSLAQTWWRFIIALVRARCWSMCWRSECLPGVLAGLLHPDQGIQERTRARLQTWHAAVEATLGQTQPVPLRAARRSPLVSWAWLFRVAPVLPSQALTNLAAALQSQGGNRSSNAPWHPWQDATSSIHRQTWKPWPATFSAASAAQSCVRMRSVICAVRRPRTKGTRLSVGTAAGTPAFPATSWQAGRGLRWSWPHWT